MLTCSSIQYGGGGCSLCLYQASHAYIEAKHPTSPPFIDNLKLVITTQFHRHRAWSFPISHPCSQLSHGLQSHTYGLSDPPHKSPFSREDCTRWSSVRAHPRGP